ncbi:MAG: IS30 family transposase [Patescibacteria group bacterium]
MKYQHLRVEEREELQRGLWRKESIRSIAARLGRSHSSLAREVRKNKPPIHNQYTPRLAHERALRQRKSRGRKDRLKNERTRSYIVEHLKLRWSPEQIAGRMRRDGIGSISPEAIYQFVYAQLSYGRPRKGCEDLRPYLRRRRKQRIPKGARCCQRVFKPRGTSIDERPKIVEKKKRCGDWEGDTVESCDHKPGINTTLERKSGIVQITKLASKSSTDTIIVLDRRFKELPPDLKRTLTLDNGPENKEYLPTARTWDLQSTTTSIFPEALRQFFPRASLKPSKKYLQAGSISARYAARTISPLPIFFVAKIVVACSRHNGQRENRAAVIGTIAVRKRKATVARNICAKTCSQVKSRNGFKLSRFPIGTPAGC